MNLGVIKEGLAFNEGHKLLFSVFNSRSRQVSLKRMQREII